MPYSGTDSDGKVYGSLYLTACTPFPGIRV